jgi:hypothetical protein
VIICVPKPTVLAAALTYVLDVDSCTFDAAVALDVLPTLAEPPAAADRDELAPPVAV